MGTPLSVASFMGRAGIIVDARCVQPVSLELYRAKARVALLESENKSLSAQLEAAINETLRLQQKRRAIPAKLTLSEIVDAVAEFYEVSPMKIMNRKRFPHEVHARHVACYVAYEMTDMSFPQIGRAFAGRDHSTIYHGVEKIRKERSARGQLDSEIIQIIFELDRRA